MNNKNRAKNKDDKEVKDLVKNIKEPRENKRNIKTANSHQSIPRYRLKIKKVRF